LTEEQLEGNEMTERTLAIIKPDAVKKRLIGKIIQRIEDEGFSIEAMKLVHLTKEQAEGFYVVHKDKPFYDSLTDFMSSGKIVVMTLEKEAAISDWRKVMGATDPAKAEPGTLRREFGFSVERNATHGSDASETAAWEIDYFFMD
jgi:nucleoside-diphosphate kinase